MDSYGDFISSIKDNGNVRDLQEPANKHSDSLFTIRIDTLKKSIDMICKYQKPFIKKSLDKLLENSIENADIVCN